jgi:adenylyl-sulfate kinase
MVDYSNYPKRGMVIWLTGLSGAGKTTLSKQIFSVLRAREMPTVLLDGDVLRSGLNRDLGFSAADRAENIRRAAEVAKILSDNGSWVIAAFITPLDSLRRAVRGIFAPQLFVEVFVQCPLEVCESRDPKGLYKRARKGEIKEFTGISSPFYEPEDPDIVVPTHLHEIDECAMILLRYLDIRFKEYEKNKVTKEESTRSIEPVFLAQGARGYSTAIEKHSGSSRNLSPEEELIVKRLCELGYLT